MSSLLLSIVAGIVLFTLCYWMLTFFLSEKYINWFCRILLCVSFNAVLIFINQLNMVMVNISATLLLFILIGMFFFNGNRGTKLIVSLTAPLLEILAEFIVTIILSIAIKTNLIHMIDTTIKGTVFSYISATLYCCIVLLTRYFTQLKKKKRGNALFVPNLFVILLPIFTIFLLYFLLVVNLSMISDSNIHIYNMIIITGLLFINLFFILMDDISYKSIIEESKKMEMEYQIELKEQIIRQQSKNIEKLEAAAHDYSKTLSVIKALACESDSNNKTVEYIEDALQSIIPVGMAHRFESKALTAIVNDFSNRCQEKQIDFIMNITFDELDFISFPDLCTILSNLLENAFEAVICVQDSAFISLTIKRVNRMLFIEILNSHCNKITVNDGVFTSTKKNKNKRKGVGTNNVRQIVSKYNGDASFTYDDKLFRADIYMPIPKE